MRAEPVDQTETPTIGNPPRGRPHAVRATPPEQSRTLGSGETRRLTGPTRRMIRPAKRVASGSLTTTSGTTAEGRGTLNWTGTPPVARAVVRNRSPSALAAFAEP